MNRAIILTVMGLTLATAAQAEVVESTLELDGITRIDLSGPYQLDVTLGDKEFVTVTTDEEHLDKIEAKVRGSRLVLGAKDGTSWNWFDFDDNDVDAIFTVQVRTLEELRNHGSGDVSIGAVEAEHLEIGNHGSGEVFLDAFRGKTLEFSCHGSGNGDIGSVTSEHLAIHSFGSGDISVDEAEANSIELGVNGSSDLDIGTGRANTVEVSIRGSGDVDVGDVVADTAEVAIFGSGDVQVHANNTLDVTVYGSGDVRYSGDPDSISRSVRGSGDITPR